MARLIYFMILLYILMGCNDKSSVREQDCLLKFDTRNWNVEKQIALNTIEEINLLPLETSDSVLIGEISKIVCTQKYYFIADNKYSKKIFVFDKHGKYLYSIGKIGQGPGEHLNLADFIVDEDKNIVYILDRESSKLFIYNLTNGDFIRNIKLKFWSNNFAQITPELFVFWSLTPNPKLNAPLIYYNILNGQTKTYLKYDEYDTSIFSRYNIINSDKILYSSFLRDEVYSITKDGVTPYIKFDFGDKLIPAGKIKNANTKSIIELISNSSAEWSYNATNFLETSDFLTFNLSVRNRTIFAIYSKKSGIYLYGSSYEGLFKLLGSISNIAIDGENFISVVNSRRLEALIRSVREKKYDTSLIENWSITDSLDLRNANPILVLTKYKHF